MGKNDDKYYGGSSEFVEAAYFDAGENKDNLYFPN